MLELNEEENALVARIEEYLDTVDHDDSVQVKEKFECLDNLGRAISQYPSIRKGQKLRGVERTEEQLLQALCSFASPSYQLNIPVRVVASRSYLVAKYQAFSMLHILAGKQEEFILPLRRAILTVIHTLMTEEVYFACLNDSEFAPDVKLKLAYDLISLWDSGTDPRTVQHLPALDSLWTARDSSPPAFGTMNGTTELLRITMDMSSDWQEFLVDQMSNSETKWALEEFLFGLSFEETATVRSRLIKFGINAVGHDEIPSYLGSHPAYGIINSSDFRAMYNFYVDRRDASRLRRRLAVPGPFHTIEEIYLKYRIVKEGD
jgi:hypothetical protein